MDSFQTQIPPFVSKQAISKARQGISHMAFLDPFRLSVKQFYDQATNLHTWNGFHIYSVDGNTIQIPESEENDSFFQYSASRDMESLTLRSIHFLLDDGTTEYLSNLTAMVKRMADSMIVSSEENIHNYQSNRSYILNRIKSNIIFLLRSLLSVCSKMLFRIMEEASKILSIVRPDRKFGRYRKHTRRRYYNHMKSCI